MTIEFTPWPATRAELYRQRGYWLAQPLTQILQQNAQPDDIAILCGERQFSYAELDQRSTNLAARLAESGLGHGDSALVQLPNSAEFYLVLFALLKCGVVPVLALYNHRQMELRSYAEQIKPRLLIGCREHEVFRDDAFIHALSEQGIRPPLKLFLHDRDSACDLTRWLNEPPSTLCPYAPTPADQVALFQLSGGSTGTPKLIPRTHDDYLYNVRACAEICGLSRRTRFLCALPAGHNFPLSSSGALGVFYAGGSVVMASSPEPSSCFALIARHQINTAALVPSAVALWLQAAPSHAEQIASLELLQVGGASFAEALARQVPSVLGCQLQQVFGMAEGLINYTRLDDPQELVFTSQGRPICPDDEIKIVDEQGQPVAAGQPGILATRGPYTFCGYYLSPKHNAQAFDNEGFYYSGDIVQQLPDGYLQVVGRVKDQINRGGEKIASEEIENLLLGHADITHAALVALPDTLLGEKSCAFIVSRNPALKAVALRRYLMAQGIAEYKLPDRVRLLEQMPLTAVGKIDKKQLREQLNQELDAAAQG
ncbi:(2,3-dihydroxybenzoyl)adenylate synthase [Pseudomonas sp. 5P_3.1_Bac2]|uniref:(2,3-dihydroxybenzoyl)adenylate synthase n=1 Tax=Pseudomonas sp. 5P_3.1_Bac2 TaxID=2971617 RepID=UPI0021C96797|nr:(2,3-dihydroxybenzoyl)adenylate synthase [Pseudomonas sp. 5P_3.1_Bac2]MCU1717158.1 (2,3-dihydroxybenzoyl)adenylate synthase [Pseudomonas sp. 5P_3.1_Bac2]